MCNLSHLIHTYTLDVLFYDQDDDDTKYLSLKKSTPNCNIKSQKIRQLLYTLLPSETNKLNLSFSFICIQCERTDAIIANS